jgi:hypothetical protein
MRLAALALGLSLSGAALAYGPSTPAEGCWVRFYGERDYTRLLVRVTGPLFLNSFAGPGYVGQLSVRDFPARVHSLAVGPQAHLVVFGERAFTKELSTLGPDRKIPDATALGFPRDVGSIKIVCDR